VTASVRRPNVGGAEPADPLNPLLANTMVCVLVAVLIDIDYNVDNLSTSTM